MYQISTVTILVSIFLTSVSAAASLVEGAPGMHPSEICRSAGLLDAVATSLNLNDMREMLHLSGVPRAYVSGFNDELKDFVVHAMGAVAEHHPLTNPASHAFCIKADAVPLNECITLNTDHQRLVAPTSTERFARCLGERLAAPLTAEKLQPVLEVLRETVSGERSQGAMRCRRKEGVGMEALHRLAKSGGAMRCRRKSVLREAPVTAPMRCRPKPATAAPVATFPAAAPLTGAMRCRWKRNHPREATFDQSLGETVLGRHARKPVTGLPNENYLAKIMERLMAERSETGSSPCSIQGGAPAPAAFGAAKRVTGDALELPSIYEVVALRSLLNSIDQGSLDLEELRNLENKLPNVSRVVS